MNITVSLFAQVAAFVLLVWFVNKFLWGPMSTMMAERQKKIADGLAASDKGKEELERAEHMASQILKEAKTQASEVIAQSDKRASEITDHAKETGKEEGDRLIAAAKSEIDQEVNRAKEQLRKQVLEIALEGAGKILDKEIDAKTHGKLMDKLVSQI